MTIANRTYTIAEFMALPNPIDGTQQELVRGEIREMPPAGEEHGAIGGAIFGHIWMYLRQNNLGKVYQDTGVVIDPVLNTVRAPDVAFIRKERFSGRVTGALPVEPDLAVEVISPYDRYGDVEDKVEDYLRAGVRLVWVVNPRRKFVEVYHPNVEQPTLLNIDDELNGEDVLPGFTLKVRALFEDEV